MGITNQLGEAFVPIRATLDQFDKDLKGARGILQNAVTGLAKTGVVAVGAAGVAGAAAVGKFASDSISAFIPFQEQMNEVFTLLPGLSQDAMNNMTDQVLKFSSKFGTLPEDVVPALYQAISAGVPADNVFSFLETSQKAATGGVTELETAVDGISSVVNAYGKDVISAAEASDLMFTAVKLGKTDFEQLSKSLFNVIPTASSLGVQFGDVTAALATMTAQGTPTSVATTQLRQLLVELGDGGKAAGRAIQDATGMGFDEFIAQGNSLQDALAFLPDAAAESGLSLQQMFGSIEAGNAALALTGKGSESFTSALSEMATASGATSEAFDQVDDSFGKSKEKLDAFIQTTKIMTGEALSPLISKFFELVQGAMPQVQEFFERAQPVIEKFSVALGGRLGPAALIIGDAFTRIAKAFGFVDDESSGMDAALKLLEVTLGLTVTAVEATAVAVSLLADFIEKKRTQFDAFTQFWGDVYDRLSELDDIFFGLIDQVKTLGGEFLKLELPSWLTPGSPTPLELGLAGIGQAVNRLPNFSNVFSAGNAVFGGLATADAGAIGGRTTIINIDGVTAASGDTNSIDEAIRLTAQVLRDALETARGNS